MTAAASTTDYVQLPADSTGKKVAFVLASTIDGGQLYLPASLAVDAHGNVVDVYNQGLAIQEALGEIVDILRDIKLYLAALAAETEGGEREQILEFVGFE